MSSPSCGMKTPYITLAAVCATLSSCVCQVQTSKAIRLYGQECTGVVIPGLTNNKEEYYRANGVYYVKGVQTRLQRVNCETAYYQWPDMAAKYRMVPGAEQRIVYMPVTNNGLGEPLKTPPHPVKKCTKRPAPIKMLPRCSYNVCVSPADASGMEPISFLSPMQNNERAWYTQPLSTLALIALDIPGTIIGSAVGSVYTLLSPEQSFTMQKDYFGVGYYMPSLSIPKP